MHDNSKTIKSAIVHVTDATKQYPGVLALDDVSFSIQPGEVRALLGKNGAGKSTLIKMITGAETPDKGVIQISDNQLNASPENRTKEAFNYGVRSVYQELSLVKEMTVAENMYLGSWPRKGLAIDEKQMYHQAGELLTSLNIDVDPRQLVGRLSPAQQQLVEIARSVMYNPKVVILDEPTSSLANKEVKLVFDIIRQCVAKSISVIYVSHRMNEIREIADTATIMRDGKLIATEDVKSISTKNIVKMMLGDEYDKIEHMEVDSYIDYSVPPILKIQNISDGKKLKQINFDLKKNEVLGIVGVLGSGRTELLRIIAGLDKAKTGNVIYHGEDITSLNYREHIKKSLAITPENRKDDGIIPVLGVDENIIVADFNKVSKDGVLKSSKIHKEVGKIVNHMSIKTSNLKTPIDHLSGGNQQKVVIGKWIYANIDILLLDEPTRGVDVDAKQQIYKIIRKLASEGKNIIVVSSEVEELPHICDRVVILQNGKITNEFTAPNIRANTLLEVCLN